MNIYQKLVEVRKSCQYLKKDNQGYQFQYVSSSQTLGTLRSAMDEHGLLLVPSVNSFDIREHKTRKGDVENYTILDMTFTWINAEKPDEQVVCNWTGQGLDNGEKGVGKALTYAEKYFLLKFFNIATDRDDPDSFQQRNGNRAPHQAKRLPPKQLLEACDTKADLRTAFESLAPADQESLRGYANTLREGLTR